MLRWSSLVSSLLIKKSVLISNKLNSNWQKWRKTYNCNVQDCPFANRVQRYPAEEVRGTWPQAEALRWASCYRYWLSMKNSIAKTLKDSQWFKEVLLILTLIKVWFLNFQSKARVDTVQWFFLHTKKAILNFKLNEFYINSVEHVIKSKTSNLLGTI